MSVAEWLSGSVFSWIHGHNLVYNTCWEDPRLDREALELSPSDHVLVITSAGCNALDYALAEPTHVYAVDMNPRQNALLELKLAGIRRLDYEPFFAFFGNGRSPDASRLYQTRLRQDLSPWARQYWDRHIGFFSEDNRRGSFYFRGTSGTFAWAMNRYIDQRRLRPWIDAILSASSVQEQREIYDRHLSKQFWSRAVRFAMKRNAVLSLLGVPAAQREQIESQHHSGLLRYMETCLEEVFARLPLGDNYFWRVYLTGRYSPTCCPEYLKPESFSRLKAGLVDRISTHTDSVQGFLEKHEGTVSRFVLLDHMDWLTGKRFPLLESEWQAITLRAAPNSRIIWRSGGLQTDFVNRAQVRLQGRPQRVGELLTYHHEFARHLHRKCRVGTYASLSIADLKV